MAGMMPDHLLFAGQRTHLQVATYRRVEMSNRNSLFGRIGAVIGAFGSAMAAAGAAEAGRVPRARDLQRLGIDAEAYRAIGRR